MKKQALFALARKDLRCVLRSRALLLPILIVPIILLGGLPLVLGLIARSDSVPNDQLAELGPFLANLPAHLRVEIAPFDERGQILYLMLAYLFAPLFLILPLMVASVMAADSFAGEKERGTLEALIYTPLSDRELFFAKLLAPWISAFLVSLFGWILYTVVAVVVAWPLIGQVFLPNLTWVLLALWVGPAAAGAGLGATALISARVRTLQEAYQLSGVLVLPVVLMVLGQVGGLIYLSPALLFGAGAALWALVLLILWAGGRAFKRERVLTQR